MSGYLRRLASNVINPGGAIHPVVGPLFSGASYEAARLALEEEMVVAAPKPEDASAPAPEGAKLHPSVHQHQEFFVSPPEPLISRQEPPGTPEIRSVGRETALLKAAPEDIPKAQPAQPTLEGANSRTIASEPVRGMAVPPPILAVEEIPDRDNFQTILLEKSNPPQRAPRERRTTAGVAAKIEPERDEVQIHIGRIEVTAAPLPVTGPQQKTAPKSPSLSEYLKRGRGR